MNNQPYRVPDKHWPPRLSYWWFRVSNLLRKRALRSQQMGDVKLEGVEYLRLAVSQKKGVLIAPNHSFHWDSYCLLEAAYRLSIPFYMMTAWQVFSESNWLDRLSMQRCGCFSVDREGTDTQSLKTAIDKIGRAHV